MKHNPTNREETPVIDSIRHGCNKIPTSEKISSKALQKLGRLFEEWSMPVGQGALSFSVSTAIFQHIAPDLHPAAILAPATALGAMTTAIMSIPWRNALEEQNKSKTIKAEPQNSDILQPS
jgi:hypothetical protein